MAEFRTGTYPGYNKPGKGQHGTEIYFALIGSEGAIVWRLNTGIAPIGPYRSQDEDANLLYGVNQSYPLSRGIAAHSELTSRTATAEDHMITDKCEFLSGRACVCDYQEYSTKEPMMAFACEGFDGVRKVLEKKYREHYGKEA